MCAPASPPKMPIFVLQPDRARAALLDAARGVAIVGDAVEADRLDVVGIGDVGAVIDRIMVEDQPGIALAQRVGDMAGEGRKPAFARQGIADQREPPDRRVPRARWRSLSVSARTSRLKLEHAVVP